jgi:FkbM family methyltransferase
MSKIRVTQLDNQVYSPLVSKILLFFYKNVEFPFRLRILSIVERLLGNKRIITKTQFGFEIGIDRADLIQRTIFYDGIYEPEMSLLFSDTLKKNDTFYDIGANIGFYTCLALQKKVKYVVAFEPDDISYKVLLLNIELNSYNRNKYEIVNKGVSNISGNLDFWRSNVANTGISSFIPIENSTFETKKIVIDLDSFFKETKNLPTVMKIDVEGWEKFVIQGMKNPIYTSKLRCIFLETEVDKNKNIIDTCIINFLEAHKFQIKHLERQNNILERFENFMCYRNI